jgi:uncharacterized OB-fold protein
MRTQSIQDLMDYFSHCHECGALLVTVPGGAICPACGFELDEPEETHVLALKKSGATTAGGFFAACDRPRCILDEAA